MHTIKPYISLNDHLITADTPIFTANNRAFRYGDAVFESIALFEGHIPLWAYHYQRLSQACQLLNLILAPHYTAPFLKAKIIALAQKNNLENARVRLTAYRSDGGLYAPINNQAHILIETQAHNNNQFNNSNNNDLQIGICTNYTKNFDKLSHLKTANALIYVLAAQYAQQKNWHDAILLNEKKEVVEATTANIWLLQNNTIITPPLSSGCVAGVMRQYLLKQLPKIGKCVVEKKISTADLSFAQAIWLTNATQGIRQVSKYANTLFNDTYNLIDRLPTN